MLESGAIDLRPLVGKVVSLDEAPDLYRDFADGKTNNKLIVSFYN